MKEFRFYINNIEINEPKNWNDIKFSVVRDKTYFGLLRSSALETVEIFGEDIKLIKQEFDLNGFNAEATFWIERLNHDCLKYELFAQNIILFDKIEEDFTLSDGDVLKLKLVDNGALHKMTSREDTDVVVGNSETIQGQGTTLLSQQYENVLYKSRGILNEAFYNIPDEDAGKKGMSALFIPAYLNYGEYKLVPELYRDISNTIYSSDFVLHNLTNDNGNAYNSDFTSFNEDNIILGESKFTMQGKIKYFIKFVTALQYGVTVDTDTIRYSFCLSEFDFDGASLTNEVVHEIDYYEIDVTNTNYPTGGGCLQEEVSINSEKPFEKKANKVYVPYIRITSIGNLNEYTVLAVFYTDASVGNWCDSSTLEVEVDGIFDLSFHSEEIEVDTYHKTHLIYEAILSNLEQITDTPNILYSETFGRTDLGYEENGLFHNYGITSGYYLRNAVNSDLSDVEMTVNFKDLFKTLTSLFGLALWWDNDKIRIETRDIAFENPEIIEITLEDVVKKFNKDYIFTKVEVGNNNIKYENINGTNEFNNIHEYAFPINVKNNRLDLKTKYNTDYLGVELARRVQFSTDANVDTKYDEKNFIIELKYENPEWVTKLGNDYYEVYNIPIPERAGNLSLSPKRMLIRNSDFIYPSFFKNTDLELKFQKCSNLAVLESRELMGEQLIVERDNLSTFKKLFKPIIYNGVAPQFEISKIINNKEKLFKAKLGCSFIFGWLKSVEEKDGEIEIELMEKY